jgi:glutathione S-transferase
VNPALPALVTVLALVHYLVVFFNVGRARGKYAIKAPAISGHPAFESAYRVQTNTVEQLVLFLPSLWLFALFLSPLWAAVLGLVWVAGRAFYAWSYYRDPETRGPGFGIAFIAMLVLLIGGLVGAMLRLGQTGI